MHRPVIGITVSDLDSESGAGPGYAQTAAYGAAVCAAGGVPVLLTHEVGVVEDYVVHCDGFLLSGGGDPVMEPFGAPTHPEAKVISSRRQRFELALLAALARVPDKPVLGICLGMQLMALHAGAGLIQHLPDVVGDADLHMNDRRHPVDHVAEDSALTRGGGAAQPRPTVVSWHHQAVAPDPGGRRAGRLRVVAVALDGVVEAVDDPDRPFYLGVQWHPERSGDGPLGLGLISRHVGACRRPR